MDKPEEEEGEPSKVPLPSPLPSASYEEDEEVQSRCSLNLPLWPNKPEARRFRVSLMMWRVDGSVHPTCHSQADRGSLVFEHCPLRFSDSLLVFLFDSHLGKLHDSSEIGCSFFSSFGQLRLLRNLLRNLGD